MVRPSARGSASRNSQHLVRVVAEAPFRFDYSFPSRLQQFCTRVYVSRTQRPSVDVADIHCHHFRIVYSISFGRSQFALTRLCAPRSPLATTRRHDRGTAHLRSRLASAFAFCFCPFSFFASSCGRLYFDTKAICMSEKNPRFVHAFGASLTARFAHTRRRRAYVRRAASYRDGKYPCWPRRYASML